MLPAFRCAAVVLSVVRLTAPAVSAVAPALAPASAAVSTPAAAARHFTLVSLTRSSHSEQQPLRATSASLQLSSCHSFSIA